jgi:hypothetical protein
VKAWSFFGPGNVNEKVTAIQQEPDASNCLTVEYEVRVPANSTRYLLLFTRLAGTNQQASNGAEDFDQEKAYLFRGLKSRLRDRVMNWNLN